MKQVLLLILLIGSGSLVIAQDVDSTRNVHLVLMDIPFSGDDIQPNFKVVETGEFLSFNRASWLVKPLSLYDFNQRYKDICMDSTIEFTATLVYKPIEQFTYERYEGYTSTGKFENTWALVKLEAHYTFNLIVSSVVGDLNKDGLPDLAMVTQDTSSHTGQYHLEVFFTQSNGDKERIVSSTEAIEPRFPYGKESFSFGQGFSELSIHRGVLWIETEFIRGHMEHKFRFQNNHFELIGYSYANVTAGQLTVIDFNLSTGQRIEKKGTIDADVLTTVSDEIVKFRPLPALEEFSQYDNEYY